MTTPCRVPVRGGRHRHRAPSSACSGRSPIVRTGVGTSSSTPAPARIGISFREELHDLTRTLNLKLVLVLRRTHKKSGPVPRVSSRRRSQRNSYPRRGKPRVAFVCGPRRDDGLRRKESPRVWIDSTAHPHGALQPRLKEDRCGTPTSQQLPTSWRLILLTVAMAFATWRRQGEAPRLDRRRLKVQEAAKPIPRSARRAMRTQPRWPGPSRAEQVATLGRVAAHGRNPCLRARQGSIREAASDV